MSIIKLPLQYEGSEGEKTLYTLFDTNITYSCIRIDKVKNLGNLHKMRHRKLIKNVNNEESIEAEYVIVLDFYIDDILLSDEFMIIKNLSEEVVIGDLTMQKWRIKLDFETNKVIVDPKVVKFILKELK